jgi:hypothetical protein
MGTPALSVSVRRDVSIRAGPLRAVGTPSRPPPRPRPSGRRERSTRIGCRRRRGRRGSAEPVGQHRSGGSKLTQRWRSARSAMTSRHSSDHWPAWQNSSSGPLSRCRTRPPAGRRRRGRRGGTATPSRAARAAPPHQPPRPSPEASPGRVRPSPRPGSAPSWASSSTSTAARWAVIAIETDGHTPPSAAPTSSPTSTGSSMPGGWPRLEPGERLGWRGQFGRLPHSGHGSPACRPASQRSHVITLNDNVTFCTAPPEWSRLHEARTRLAVQDNANPLS